MKNTWIWIAALLLAAACSTPTKSGSKSDGGGSDGAGAGSDVIDLPTGTDGTDGDATGDGTGDGTGGTDGGTPGDGGTTGGDCDQECQDPEICIDGVCKVPQICEPGTWICENLTQKKQCNDTGTAFLDPEDCPGDQYCTSGQCGLKCNLDPKWGAYVGCVFWSVDTPVWDDPSLPQANTLPHAVVVSNPNELEAKVTFTEPPGVNFDSTELVVPGGESVKFEFPSMDPSGSDIYDTGIRIESNRPVLVHQFNPWDNTFSNDASLLLPEPLLGQEHLILSWMTDTRCLLEIPIPGFEDFGGGCSHSTLTVVSTVDNTEVTVRTSARVLPTMDANGEPMANPTVAEIPEGGIATFVLDKGQVLNLDAEPLDVFGTADLTGSIVLSNKPVAVFSGHDSVSITAAVDNNPNPFPGEEDENDSCCLDHLEEQMIPVGLLGTEYICAKSADRGGEKDIWRVIAADDNTVLTTNPPIDGLHGKTLAKRGDWVQGETDGSFEISATGRIQVGQYLVSQGQTQDTTGDPALILAIPQDRFRSTYPIMVPPKYNRDYISVIRQPGTDVAVDGFPIPDADYTPIAGGAWEVAWVQIEDGFHTISGTAPFGLSAYGYNSAASYGYPGGMTIPGEANPW